MKNRQTIKIFIIFFAASTFLIFLNSSRLIESSFNFPIKAENNFLELYVTEPGKYEFGQGLIEKQIIEKINNCSKSIYIFAFDIDNANLIEALIEAAKRNVEIKIICDLNNTPSQVLNIFQSQGWLIYYKSKKLMHHKIIIFDEKEVGLGSMNFTVSCMYVNNNDFYFIKNEAIAQFFIKYFEYLSLNKNKELLKNPVTIDGITFYFANSPYYNINDYISNILNKANNRIAFAYSTFTNKKIAEQVVKIIDEKKLFFFGILEKRNAYIKYSSYNTFLNNNLHIYLDRNDYYMHHKLLIVDNFVFTGSYAISDRTNTEKSIEFNDDLSFCFEDKKIADFLVEYLKTLILR